ncbi:MAG: hypothetical protein IT305_07465 [Chloroflexi bacterium]|nr:hypothetical protein [Chloroflexota bacterium]
MREQHRPGEGRSNNSGGPGGHRRPPARRPISSRSPLEGRQLWRIGDWGGASEQIGRRWETLGARCIERLLGTERDGPDGQPYLPRRALVLQADPELAAQVQANGKTHADAILAGSQNGRAVLEPVDFKWTLETANPRQVGAEVLGQLLTDPPPLLSSNLAATLADLPSREPPAYCDGIFLAPDHAENRAYLFGGGPLDPAWAVLCPVDAEEFFAPLPGWDMAQVLARSDGALLRTVEASERYYRLGAGVLGAIRRLEAGIFAETPADVDGPLLLTRTRRERRLTTTGEVIAYFDRALIARSERVERLREVERAGYPFSRYRADLAARGIALPSGSERDRRASRLYGAVMKALGAEIRSEGRVLVGRGRAEIEALADLDEQHVRWLARGRHLLDEQLRARAETGEADPSTAASENRSLDTATVDDAPTDEPPPHAG